MLWQHVAKFFGAVLMHFELFLLFVMAMVVSVVLACIEHKEYVLARKCSDFGNPYGCTNEKCLNCLNGMLCRDEWARFNEEVGC